MKDIVHLCFVIEWCFVGIEIVSNLFFPSYQSIPLHKTAASPVPWSIGYTTVLHWLDTKLQYLQCISYGGTIHSIVLSDHYSVLLMQYIETNFNLYIDKMTDRDLLSLPQMIFAVANYLPQYFRCKLLIWQVCTKEIWLQCLSNGVTIKPLI